MLQVVIVGQVATDALTPRTLRKCLRCEPQRARC